MSSKQEYLLLLELQTPITVLKTPVERSECDVDVACFVVRTSGLQLINSIVADTLKLDCSKSDS